MPAPSSSEKSLKKTGSGYELSIMAVDKDISVDAPIAAGQYFYTAFAGEPQCFPIFQTSYCKCIVKHRSP